MSVPRVPLGLYRLVFSGEAGHSLRFPGSAWRGAFGLQLRRLACLTGEPECAGCTETERCAYIYLFETAPGRQATKMRRYERVPNPYVLREEGGDSCIALQLTLFGRANAHLPLTVLALSRAGASTPGIGGRRLMLRYVEQHPSPGEGAWVRIDAAGVALAPRPPAPAMVPPVPASTIEIVFDTPLRVKREGRHVRPEAFRFADFFGGLLRRLSMLSAFHTDSPFETDFAGLIGQARRVECPADLRWIDLERHSRRQGATMRLGGLVGTLRLGADAAAPFWPLIWLGQFTHAGSAATMGLGHYRILSASLPPPPDAPRTGEDGGHERQGDDERTE